MFGKCLKHDLRAIWRVWWIAAASAFGMGAVGSLAVRGIIEVNLHIEEVNGAAVFFLSLVLSAVAIAAFFAVVAFCVISTILVYVRFFKNFFSDEGYLTFSLPVPRRTLYLAKTVNALIWDLATVGVVALIVTLAVLIIPTPCFTEWSTCSVGPVDLTLFRAFGRTTAELWNRCGAWLLLYGLEFLCGCVALILMDSGLVQLCITLGAVVAKKHKFLAAVGIYYAVQTGLGMLMQLLGTSMLLNMGQGVTFLVGQMNPAFRYPALAVLILLAIAVTATIGVILHFIVLDKLERRLNLA